MRPGILLHKLAVVFALWVSFGMTAKAETISGANSEVNVVVVSQAVPEPASMLLLGTGLVGVGGFVRRKLKASN